MIYKKIDLKETSSESLKRKVHKKIELIFKDLKVKFIFNDLKYNYNIYIIKLELIKKL